MKTDRNRKYGCKVVVKNKQLVEAYQDLNREVNKTEMPKVQY